MCITVYSSVKGYLGCFQFGAIKNQSCYMQLCAFLCVHKFSCLCDKWPCLWGMGQSWQFDGSHVPGRNLSLGRLLCCSCSSWPYCAYCCLCSVVVEAEKIHTTATALPTISPWHLALVGQLIGASTILAHWPPREAPVLSVFPLVVSMCHHDL